MRRSEICALTLDDIEGDALHIRKAIVLNENNEWVIKTTKTTEGTRDIVIPDADIMQMGGWKTDHVMKDVYRARNGV